MRLLLDTHILIWFLEGDSSLSAFRREIITKTENEVFVSIGSLWEMAIKISLDKLTLSSSLSDVIAQLAFEDIDILPISPSHTLQILTLPFHHKDPFDRIIIAQSIVENLITVSDDENFKHYQINLA